MVSQNPFTRVTACHVTTYYYVGFCYIMLRRYPDAIRTFVTILNFIMRMKQYHTRSYQYDQISKTADRMYALFAVCHSLSPSRLDDNIGNIAKERFAEQYAKMSRGGEDALAAFEELFLYACPKFIAANPPPYDDPAALQNLLSPPSPADSEAAEPASQPDSTHRHLQLFLSDVAAQSQVPTLRSFLKLYTSLGAKKLANFLDADEEEMVQEMMVVKQASRSISRVPGAESSGLLDGQTITTSDLNFVIAEVCLFSLRGFEPIVPNLPHRTWSISPSPPLAVAMLGGSSRTRRGHRRSWTTSRLCLFQHPRSLPSSSNNSNNNRQSLSVAKRRSLGAQSRPKRPMKGAPSGRHRIRTSCSFYDVFDLVSTFGLPIFVYEFLEDRTPGFSPMIQEPGNMRSFTHSLSLGCTWTRVSLEKRQASLTAYLVPSWLNIGRRDSAENASGRCA